MEAECKICGCPLLDDQNIARDNFGVNLEAHADCLSALTPASDGRAEGLREAAEICRLNAVQSVNNDAMPEPVGNACWSHVGQKYAAMILARAAELEKADE